MCFVDVACIHQADEDLMRRGIQSIGGFLSVSRELRILWSPVYLSRLWCVTRHMSLWQPEKMCSACSSRKPCFEMVPNCVLSRHSSKVFELPTYKKINPTGKVVLAPVFCETIAAIVYSSIAATAAAFWTIRSGGLGSGAVDAVTLLGLLATILPFLITVHCLRKSYREKRQLFSAFRSFDLDSVQCFSDEDRDFIHSTITELYGSKEAFTHYVRGPLCDELLGPIIGSPGIEQYRLLSLCPGLALAGDVALAYWKAGAPTEVLLNYVISHLFVGQLIFLPSALSLLELLCDQFPGSAHSNPHFKFLESRLQKCFLLILELRNTARPL